MAKFEIRIKPTAARELEDLGTKKLRLRIIRRIRTLADEPFPPGPQKLTGQDRHRIRVGDYRILYEVDFDDLIITVVKIAHRKEAYR